jgi:hypothetical protein
VGFLNDTITHVKKEIAWQKEYEPHAPAVGEPAVDFVLFDAEGNHGIRLSDFRGRKSVGLVFGSFT